MQIAKRISEIIQKRSESVKPLKQLNERLTNILKIVNILDESMTDFVREKEESEKGVITCNNCLRQFPIFKRKILELQHEANKQNKRFSRRTINIGFGGKKGTGKSFLLQKLSGLSSNEVPSAKGLPVTAVSSKIFNSITPKAIVSFYDESSFLNEIIAPFCQPLNISIPLNIDDFTKMEIPEVDDLNIRYCERLRAFQQNFDDYKKYLTGDTREIPLDNIRKFVAYTDSNEKEIYTYLAVKDAIIYTPFPESAVQQLGFIDLPGLGELNPTVEKRHTEGFSDDVDVVMLIRRPSSERVDWDQADHDALEILKFASPPESFPNFVVVVHNEGGCDEGMSEKSMKSMKASLPGYLQILRTRGQDTEELSRDVLEQILSHLALRLPDMDKLILDKIAHTSSTLCKDISDFSKDVHDALKASNDGGDKNEIYFLEAKKRRDEFSDGCQDALENIEFCVDKKSEDQKLVDKLDQIQESIDAYFENGLDRKTSKEDWLRRARSEIARRGNSSTVFNDTGQNIRVKIAEEFTALDDIYRLHVDGLLEKIAEQFDAVLPGCLPSKSPREKLVYLKERIDSDDHKMQTIQKAIDTVLNLKIEHRTQFYPRVYGPIREFLTYLKNNPTVSNANELDRQQQAEAIYQTLKDLSDRTIMLIVDRLREETTRINDILYVSMEHFIDKMTRSEESEMEWLRLIKAFYNEISVTESNASASLAISDMMKQLKDLQNVCI